MKITALLVDDEPKALAILKNKLERLCPNVEILAATQNPEEALTLIAQLTPQLVFLDIAMPEMNGFDLLGKIEEPTFEIIFITAFDHFAIEAINHCAIGYLVKPVDNQDLVKAVAKATENVENKWALIKNKLLVENLGVQTFQKKTIIIPAQDGLEFIKIEDIVHCEGVDGYTKIYIQSKKPLLSSNSIGHFNKLLKNKEFYLVHKSHLINTNHLVKYLNEGTLILSDGAAVPVSRNRRNDFLELIKKSG